MWWVGGLPWSGGQGLNQKLWRMMQEGAKGFNRGLGVGYIVRSRLTD